MDVLTNFCIYYEKFLFFASCEKEKLDSLPITSELAYQQKADDVKRYGFIACLIDDPSCSSGMGMRCTTNNAGGCKRSTACGCTSLKYVEKAYELFGLNNDNWDGYIFPVDNPEWNKLMWEMDSTLAIHPDSL